MADYMIHFAAMAMMMLAVQPAVADHCVRVNLLVNSSAQPWTFYWSPPLSAFAMETCGEVGVSVKLDEVRAHELFVGLAQHATHMRKLTFDFKGAIGIDWQSLGMHGFFIALSTLPIYDFTLWTSNRDPWPADAIPAFLKAVPKATSLTLKLDNTKQTDDTIAAWANALPTDLEAFSVTMQTSWYTAAAADPLINCFVGGSHLSSLRHLDLDMRYATNLTSEDKILIYQRLKGGHFSECSLRCDDITDAKKKGLSSSLAAVACSGFGNCNGTHLAGDETSPAVIIAGVCTMVIIIFSLLGVYIRLRSKRALVTCQQEMSGPAGTGGLLGQQQTESLDARPERDRSASRSASRSSTPSQRHDVKHS